MSISSPTPIHPVTHLTDRLIATWRMTLGLIVAIIAAPTVAGLLCLLIGIPAEGMLTDIGAALAAMGLFLYMGLVPSLQATLCIALPGIFVMRWLRADSPAICAIGGGFVGLVGAILFYLGPITRIDTEIEWRLLAVLTCSGALAALPYWWIAERPRLVPNNAEQDS